MFEIEVDSGEGVGDEEPTVDWDGGDDIAGDVASSDAAAVTDIICDADASICLDRLPLADANAGCVSISKVRGIPLPNSSNVHSNLHQPSRSSLSRLNTTSLDVVSD